MIRVRILHLLVALLFIGCQSHQEKMFDREGHLDREEGQHQCKSEPCVSSEFDYSVESLGDVISDARAASITFRRQDWKHWIDADGDCMNTRHELLKEQADGPIHLSPDGCYVSTGVWDDPYSGKRFYRASDLDVDHIVPLKWANNHGGNGWSKQKKMQFANDPINLLVVDDGLNSAKGAKGPAEWMPPNISFQCQYLSMWGAVLNKYQSLKMSAEDIIDFEHLIQECNNI